MRRRSNGTGRRAGGRRSRRADGQRSGQPGERAVVPAVGKALEASLVVLFLGLVTTSMFGGLVPEYRTAAGDELADRTVSTAAHRVQQAAPPNATAVDARHRVELPERIRGDGYRIVAENGSLVLEHPEHGVGARARLALPDHVVAVEGEWHSAQSTVVAVESVPGGVRIRLIDGGESG